MPDRLRFSEIVAEFDYRPNRLKSVGLFCLSVGGMALLTYFAIYLDEPVNVKGFELTAQQGRLFLWIVATFSSIGVVALLGLVYLAFMKGRRVALTRNSLLVPRPTRIGLSFDEIELELESIRSAKIVPFIGSALVLQLIHQGGVIQLPSNMFENRQTFVEMATLVQNTVDAARLAAE